MTKPRDMYDLSIEPADPQEVRVLIKQARAAVHEAAKLRNGNKAAALAKAFGERRRAK